MSVINTNFKSLITQNNLTVNNRNLSEAMEKLSTGKRINSASDDAAGLAISNKMTAQIRGLNQSVRNANDGISMVQTAEGALTEVTNMLQRMRELAVQSASDTNTSSDRFALDLEYQQLGREISRIATNTQWNAMNILNNTEVGVAGSAADVGAGVRNVKFQVGANPNQVINIGLKDFSYNLGVPAVPSESKFSLGDITANNGSSFSFVIGKDPINNADYNASTATQTAITFSLTRNIAGATMTEEELVDFETKMNKAITDTAGYSNVSVTRVGNDIYVRDAEGRAISGFGTTTGAVFTANTSYSGSGKLVASSIAAGSTATAAIAPAATAVFSGSARLNDTTIKTQAGSNLAISRLDNAMANVDHELAVYGSIMNRLTYAGDNLTNVSQNTSFSRSRILDTDYASATTELARTQIIQQAGMAMLAQANQQPQTVLSLLQ
jgi:flagellin